MKKIFLLILLSLGLTAISYAGPYDDWPDDAICMWLDQKPTHEGYLGEAKKREISCEGGVAIKTSSNASSESTTITKANNSSNNTNSEAMSEAGREEKRIAEAEAARIAE